MRRLVIGLTLMWVGVIVWVVACRIGYPLELEWMEGGSLLQALRLQRGQAIYPAPSIEYIPFLYTPLYPLVLAALGQVFPLDYALGRVVSVVAVVAICSALWRAVRREGKPAAHAWSAVGLFLSGYVFTFRWFDLARPDSLALAFTLWATVLLRDGWGDRRKTLLAGLLMAAAFWTKQTSSAFVVAGTLGGLWVAPRHVWLYVVAIAAVAGGGVLWGQAATDGWLWTYIYELHQTHAFNSERFTTKTWGMFLHASPFVALFLLGWAIRFWSPWWLATRRFDRGERRRLWTVLRAHRGLGYWGVLAAAGLLVSALGYSTQWAEPNAFLPGVCFVAVFVAVSLPVGGRVEIVGLGLVAAQLLFALIAEPIYQPIQNHGLSALARSYVWQDPWRTLPQARSQARARDLRAELRSGGRVFALQRPWWSVIAGGPGHVGSMNLSDVQLDDRKKLRRNIAQAIEEGEYAGVWLEGEAPKWLRRALGSTYTLRRRWTGSQRVRPLVGYMSEAGMVTPYRAPQVEFRLPQRRQAPPGTRVIAGFEDGTAQGFTLRGAAFGRGPVRSMHRKLPAIGPLGGEYLLSSAAARRGLKAKGEARSPAFVLPAKGGKLELLLGYAGRRRGLEVMLVKQWGDDTVALLLGGGEWGLSPLSWRVPKEWSRQSVRLVLVDADAKGAVFVDDVWAVPAATRHEETQD